MATFIGANENRHLVERFTFVNPDLILDETTIEEPTTFMKPWRIEMTWVRVEEQQNKIVESACHEGNYALTIILVGARALEGAK